MNEPRDAEWERQHLHALFYDAHDGLGICGCGNPEEAYGLVRDLLNAAPFYDDPCRVDALIGTAGAVMIVLGQLDRVGLIEHGSSIGGSWLTGKGKYVRWMMGRHEWESSGFNMEFPNGVDDAGSPHQDDAGCADCTPECWVAPEGVLPPEPPEPTMGELADAARREIDEARAAMPPWQRAVLDQIDRDMEHRLLYGTPAPKPPPAVFDGLLATTGVPGFNYNTPTGPVDWEKALQALWTNGGMYAPPGKPLPSVTPPAAPERAPEDRLPAMGRNPFIGCREIDGTFIHGRPHDCPRWARGYH